MRTATPTPADMSMKTRHQLNLPRKLWHMSTVLGMFFIFRYSSTLICFLLLLIFSLLFIPIDFMRQNNPRLNEVLVRRFRFIIRRHEIKSLAGTTYLLTGVFLIFLFCPKSVVELTLLFLAVGDPVASYCGIRFGRDKIWNQKTLQGTLGAFVACSILAGLYFYVEGLMVERLFVASLCSGAAAALCELVPLGRLDDNLTFPLLCSICLWTIYYLFGAFF